MENIKFGPIDQKVENFTVQAQWKLDNDCSVDCTEVYFTGDEGGILWGGCTKHTKKTPNVSPWW